MKKFKFVDLFGWILITAGIVIFGTIVYQSIFRSVLHETRPGPRSKKPAAAQPLRPIWQSKALKKVKGYLKSQNTQLVEGFSAIDAFSKSGNYDSWKGKVQSWWEYSDKKDQKVTWSTRECPEKKNTTLVFSGVLGVAVGEGQLYVNDKPVLTFNTGIGPKIEEWKKDDFQLKFFALRVKTNQERLGVFCLTMPEEDVSAGEPVQLKVTGYRKTGPGNSFFMLSKIPDTLSKLKLD